MEYILALPVLGYFLYSTLSYYMQNKRFNFNRNFIILIVLSVSYVGLSLVVPHPSEWYFSLLQLGIGTVFFVLMVGALGKKVSGASILAVNALITLSPAFMWLWTFLGGFICVLVAAILTTMNRMKVVKSMITEVSLNPGAKTLDYSYLPDHQETLTGTPRTYFVPLYALLGVSLSIIGYALLQM